MLRSLIIAGALACVPVHAETLATHIYVATHGNDSWSGNYPDSIQGTDRGPLRTIEAALAAAADALDGENPSVFVEVRDGRYTMDQPLSITNANSGAPDRPFVLTGYKSERPVIDLQKSGSSIVKIDSAHDIVVSNLILAGKATVGIELTGTDRIDLQRLDLSVFDHGVKILDSGVVSLAGNHLKDSPTNQDLLDSMEFPSSASGNLLISSQLADADSDDSILILAQNRTGGGETTAIKQDANTLRDGLVAHYSFGPDNWRTDRIARQNIVVKGVSGIMKPGHIGSGLRLRRNSIQYAPISWNGSDLPRTINFWYWNADNVRRDTFFFATESTESSPGFTLVSSGLNGGELILKFGSDKKIWPEPNFLGDPTMLTMVVPKRGARLDEVTLFVNGELLDGAVTGDNPVFSTSDRPPHIASTPTQLNISGQRHLFDELSFWNRALERSEIEALFNSGEGLALFPIPRAERGGFFYPRSWDWAWQIDTDTHKARLIEIWDSLKQLDIGGGVPTLENRRFQGTPTRTILVDGERGNDFFGSGSSSRPFKSIHRALESVRLDGSNRLLESTLIEVAPGVYELDDRLKINVWASPDKWFAIRGRANGDQRPIITYSNKMIERAIRERESGGRGAMLELFMVQGQYVELSRLLFDQRRDELPGEDQTHQGALRFFSHIGQIASNGVGCRVLDVEIRNFLHAGIKGDAKGLIIDGVFIHDGGNTWHDHGIYISAEGTGSGFEVRRSLILNATGAGTNQHKSSDGNDLPPPEGARITHNVMLGNGWWGVTTAGLGGEIAHNAIGYAGGFGIHFYRSTASLTRVQNNILIGYPDPTVPDIEWISLLLNVVETKRPAGVIVQGNFFEAGHTTKRQARPSNPNPWEQGKTYYTSNTVEKNGRYYICEVINNSKQVSTTGPSGNDPNLPSDDGDNIRWWYLTDQPHIFRDNLEGGNRSDFVDPDLGDFHLRESGDAVGIGVDMGYRNGTNPGPWPNPVP